MNDVGDDVEDEGKMLHPDDVLIRFTTALTHYLVIGHKRAKLESMFKSQLPSL